MAPRDRDIAMVFQNYALYPHLTVYDNIAFGLRLRKTPKDEIDRRVRHAAEVLGLEDFLERKPRALSGGQRQRVAMGRAIVREPQAFLMDEPLSNLDAKLRVQMRAEISSLQDELGVTTVYVTHDQIEAMTMGDRVAVMRKGELQQVAAAAGALRPPRQPVRRRLHRQPHHEHGGGDGGATIDGGLGVTVGEQRLTLAPEALRRASGAARRTWAARWSLGMRPEDLEDAAIATDMPEDQRLRGKLDAARGARLRDRRPLRDRGAARAHRGHPRAGRGHRHGPSLRGARQEAQARPPSSWAASTRGPRCSEGETVEVAVDTRALHFFDIDTGLGIYDGADVT